MEPYGDDWYELVTLTEAMLRSAQEQDWEGLVSLEQERCSLLERLTTPGGLVSPGNEENRDTLSALIRTVLELDRQVMVLATERRQVLAGKIQGLRVGARARAAYNQLS